MDCFQRQLCHSIWLPGNFRVADHGLQRAFYRKSLPPSATHIVRLEAWVQFG